MNAPPDPTAEPIRPTPSRRRALVLGTCGAGALLAVLGLRACVPWREVALPDGLVHLSPTQARLFARLLPVFLPVDGLGLIPLDRLPLVQNIDRQIGRLPRDARALLDQALLAMDHGATMLAGGLTRAVNLDDRVLLTYMHGWSTGAPLQRAAFGAVKQLVVLAYFGDPASWGPLEYDGPLTAPRKIPRLGNQPLPAI